MRSRREAGFTIIELMIAVLVLGVLVALALPSYMGSIRKGRRSEAFSAIAQVQQAQERWRSNNAAYTTSLADLSIGSATTSSGYYTLAMTAPPSPATLGSGYIVTAIAVTGTTQADDAQCRKLGVMLNGGNLTYAGCGSCSFAAADFSSSNACWAR